MFETPAALLACLEAVALDSEAAVVRVKNRLDAGYDARGTAGYRDVLLNVRLETAETRRLGLEGHVCEVQLVLRDFALLQVGPALHLI